MDLEQHLQTRNMLTVIILERKSYEFKGNNFKGNR